MENNMEQFRLVVDLFASIVESFYLHKVVSVHFAYRKKYSEWFIVFLVILGGTLSHFGNRNDVFVWGTIMIMVEIFVFMFSFLKGNAGAKIVVLTLSFLFILCNDMLVFMVYVLFTNDSNAYNVTERPLFRATITIITKITLLLWFSLYLHINKKRKTIQYQIGNIEKVTLLLIWIGSICIASGFYYIDSNHYFYLFLLIGVLVLFQLKMYDWIRKHIEKTQEDILFYRMEAKKQEMHQRHFTDSVNIYYKLKVLRHDMKHHASYMDYLLQERNYLQLNDYLEEIKKEQC